MTLLNNKLTQTFSKTQLAIAGVVIIALAWFAFGGALNWWDNRKALKEVEAQKAEAQKAREEAAKFKTEADQQKGRADAAAEDARKARDEAAQLQAELEEARARSDRAVDTVRRVRTNPIRRAGTVDERSKRLGSDLQQLYGNSTGENP